MKNKVKSESVLLQRVPDSSACKSSHFPMDRIVLEHPVLQVRYCDLEIK